MSENFETMTDEELDTRLDALGRPAGMLIGPEHLDLRARFERAQAARLAWDAANPQARVEHNAILGEMRRRSAAKDAAEAAKKEADRINERIEDSRAGMRNLEALRRGLSPTAGVDAVRQFLESDRTFLLLSGTPGVGKSVATMLAIEAFAKQGRRALFVRAPECSRLSMFGDADKAFVSQMRRVPLLILDDLGVESYNDAWRETFDDVIDIRYQDRLSTILTTNLPPRPPVDKPKDPSFLGRYGERIADRIRHDGLIVKCGDTSLRSRPVDP